MPKTLIVIPCYNEEKRLHFHNLDSLLSVPELSLLFVNDGSTDATRNRLDTFRESRPQSVHVLNLDANVGKAEAVRRGMLHAVELEADITGYLDADLATPAKEFARLLHLFQQSPSSLNVLIGARVRLLGRDIQRSPLRHILGRIFATTASLLLDVPVYDTQCGAKLFKNSPELRSALNEPFSSRWVFDVELLGRLIHGGKDASPMPLSAIMEEPLMAWRDVKGSKLGTLAMVRAAMDLLKIRSALKSRTRC